MSGLIGPFQQRVSREANGGRLAPGSHMRLWAAPSSLRRVSDTCSLSATLAYEAAGYCTVFAHNVEG